MSEVVGERFEESFYSEVAVAVEDSASCLNTDRVVATHDDGDI